MKLTFKVVNQMMNITIFDLIVFWGLVENAEKGNIEKTNAERENSEIKNIELGK